MLYFAVAEAHDEVVEYMFMHNWRVETLNDPCVSAQRTPVLEAIRWNRQPLVELLLRNGADARALAANPFQPEIRNWSALHVFAQEGHNKDISLVQTLVGLDVPVDGPPPPQDKHATKDEIDSEMTSLSIEANRAAILACESPIAVAIRRNAFNLASTFLSLGADPNALTLSSGLFNSTHPLTVLGHIIISNARYSSARLKYLLCLTNAAKVSFIVEPTRQLAALHRAAMAYQDVSSVITGKKIKIQEFEMETNRDIMYELLLHWPASEDLNAISNINGNTALHLAVESGNLGAVESLLKAGADASILNSDKETALQVAEKLAGQSKVHEEIVLRLRLGGNVMRFFGGTREGVKSSGEGGA
jgi:ankyrin repeat protein